MSVISNEANLIRRIDRQNLLFRLVATLLAGALFIPSVSDWLQVLGATSNYFADFSITWGIPLAGLLVFAVLVFIWVLLALWLPALVNQLSRPVIWVRERLGLLRWLVIAYLLIFPARVLLFTNIGVMVTTPAARLALLVSTAAGIALLATRSAERLVAWGPALVGLLSAGSAFALGSELVWVTDYPLSLSWSEGNRIWDYSILFGRRLYNYPAGERIEAYIDQGRQAVWGLPFLLPGVTIWQERLWSAIVVTLPYAMLGWAAFRPARSRLAQWAWAGPWAFIFLDQGPIYTPLVLCAILVALARRRPFWVALPLVFIAGYYAELSRMTWMFAPAIWAGVNALVDPSTGEATRDRSTWARAISLGAAGLLGGFIFSGGWRRLATYFGGLSGTSASSSPAPVLTPIPTLEAAAGVSPVEGGAAQVIDMASFNQAITNQPLLWERLWPNPTYGMGIVPGLLLATGALVALIGYLLLTQRWKLSFWQSAGMLGALVVFLAVGLVVSVKIGGGSNLHNLDMFLISLVFVAALAWEAAGQPMIDNLSAQSPWFRLLLLLAIGIPAFQPFLDGGPLELPPADKVKWTLELVREEVERVQAEGGEVLFMDQRQLLTFGEVPGARLVPEYEKKLVMDKALSSDAEYFREFYRDLAAKRFGAIITEPLKVRFSDEEEDWGAENDAWVTWVSEPVLCYYEPAYTIRQTRVWILTPREGTPDCGDHLR